MAFGGAFSPCCGLGRGVTGVAISNKFETLGFELIERGRHRFDCSRVNVVGQHDGTRSRLLENPTADYCRAGPFPVERVNVPEDDVVSEFVVDPSFLPLSDRSIRWSKQGGTLACGAFDRIISSLHLAANIFLRHLREVWMRPTVVANFVAFLGSLGDDFRMFGDVFANNEKG